MQAGPCRSPYWSHSMCLVGSNYGQGAHTISNCSREMYVNTIQMQNLVAFHCNHSYPWPNSPRQMS